MYEEKDIALLAAGSMTETAIAVRQRLKEQGYLVSVVNARFIKPVDEEMIEYLAKNHKLLVTLEENVLSGGFGEHVLRIVSFMNLKIKVFPVAIPNVYVEHGNLQILKQETGIDADSIAGRIRKKCEESGL